MFTFPLESAEGLPSKSYYTFGGIFFASEVDRMAGSIVNIPISAVAFAFQRGKLNQLRIFAKIKAHEGRSISDPSKYDKKDLNSLCRLGWLKLHRGIYYQVKWIDASPLDGKYTHCKISVEYLDNPKKFKAMLFLAGYAFLMSPQTQREIKSRRGYKRRSTQVNELDRNIGGISHSICMKFFGFKRTWCSNMRRLCEELSLARWERRWIPVELQKAHGTYPYSVVEQLMDGPGRYRQRGENIEEEITSKFIQVIDPLLHVPFEYRRTVKFHYL